MNVFGAEVPMQMISMCLNKNLDAGCVSNLLMQQKNAAPEDV